MVLCGLAILLRSDIHLERRMIRQIGITDGLLLLYSMTSYIETCLGNRKELSVWRPLLSTVDYSLTSLILISVIMIVYPWRRRYLYLPWAVNTLLCVISIPTGIVFSFTDDNHFSRGVLGYLPFVINAIYLVYLQFRILKNRRWEKNEYIVLAYMLLTAVICLFMPLTFSSGSDKWLMLTLAIDMLVYYVFLLQQFTTRDLLTNLFNRKRFYSDLEKLGDSISALITIDMNGLKEINDCKGHDEGDKALKTIAECFEKAVNRKYHIYRIGGDEFTILCTGVDETKVQILMKRIERELEKTDYSCSAGYAMNSSDISFDELYRRADEMMYKEKKQYYIRSRKKRRKRHPLRQQNDGEQDGE